MSGLAATSDARARPAWFPWTLLVIGVLSASASAIFVRYAEGADPLAISFWRCALGTLVLAPFATRGLRRVGRSQLRLPIIAGAFLAVHFATWITSLGMTSVASAVLLVSTTPVFVALSERFIFKTRLPRAAWIGIALTLAGTALVSAGAGYEGASLSGDILALIGGATVAGYVLAGRAALREMGILEYAVITYGSSALFVFAVALLAGAPLLGFDGQAWLAIAAIVVGPQLMGHTLINYALKDIDPTTVSVTVMAEPVIAIVLAWILFSEAPSAWVYPGGAAILYGIWVVSSVRKEPVVISE